MNYDVNVPWVSFFPTITLLRFWNFQNILPTNHTNPRIYDIEANYIQDINALPMITAKTVNSACNSGQLQIHNDFRQKPQRRPYVIKHSQIMLIKETTWRWYETYQVRTHLPCIRILSLDEQMPFVKLSLYSILGASSWAVIFSTEPVINCDGDWLVIPHMMTKNKYQLALLYPCLTVPKGAPEPESGLGKGVLQRLKFFFVKQMKI